MWQFSKILRFIPNHRNYGKEAPKSFWSFLKSDPGPPKPPRECCKERRRRNPRVPDPDLSAFEGKPYRTCGSAYILQRDTIPRTTENFSQEEKILRHMEADLTLKDSVEDPMPPYRGVGQRLLDLNDRGLHPFYKRYMSRPKRPADPTQSQRPRKKYLCKSDDVTPEEIPEKLQINKEIMLDQKNIYNDTKKILVPKQMLVRMVEMEKNRKSTLQKTKGTK